MKKTFLTLFCLLAAVSSWADITPRPQIVYTFKYFTDTPLEINPKLTEQIQCGDNQCMNGEPLGVYGIQKLTCDMETCAAVAYKFQPFQKLIVTFADGTSFESPVFEAPASLKTAMQVNVHEDRLEVAPLPHTPKKDAISKSYIIASFASVLVLEVLASLIFLLVGGLPLSILIYAAIANIISIPFNWYVLPHITTNTGVMLIITFIFELLFIHLLNRKKITFMETAGMVFVANVASFAIGMAASYMFTFF